VSSGGVLKGHNECVAGLADPAGLDEDRLPAYQFLVQQGRGVLQRLAVDLDGGELMAGEPGNRHLVVALGQGIVAQFGRRDLAFWQGLAGRLLGRQILDLDQDALRLNRDVDADLVPSRHVGEVMVLGPVVVDRDQVAERAVLALGFRARPDEVTGPHDDDHRAHPRVLARRTPDDLRHLEIRGHRLDAALLRYVACRRFALQDRDLGRQGADG
jgi:hypothetical protein